MGNFDNDITRVASQQHGAFHRRQALTFGNPGLIQPRVRSGWWVVRARGVYSLVGAADTWQQRLWVGLLDVSDRSLASHQSAARVHRAGGVEDVGAVVSSDRQQGHSFSTVTLHRPTDLSEEDRTVVDGFPVTTLERTVIDLAAVIARPRLSMVVQGLVIERRTSLANVGELMMRVSKRGKPGMAKMAAVLDDLGAAPVPRSELERRLDVLLVRTGLRFVNEHPLPTDGSVVGFVDRTHVESRLIIEADGRKWHGRLQNLAKDRQRDQVAAAQGFQTLRFTWDDVVGDPDGVLSIVRSVVAHRAAA